MAAGSGQERYPLNIISHMDHVELQHVIKEANLVADAVADSGLTTSFKVLEIKPDSACRW